MVNEKEIKCKKINVICVSWKYGHNRSRNFLCRGHYVEIVKKEKSIAEYNKNQTLRRLCAGLRNNTRINYSFQNIRYYFTDDDIQYFFSDLLVFRTINVLENYSFSYIVIIY